MQPKFCNQSEFARLLGCHKTYVTRLKQSARLVLTAEGLVDVEASLELVKSTADPARARNPQTGAAGDYLAARAMRVDYQARLAKLEYEIVSGEMVPAADVCRFVADLGAIVRTGIELLRDRISADLAAMTETEEVYAALGAEGEKILEDMAGRIEKWDSKFNDLQNQRYQVVRLPLDLFGCHHPNILRAGNGATLHLEPQPEKSCTARHAGEDCHISKRGKPLAIGGIFGGITKL